MRSGVAHTLVDILSFVSYAEVLEVGESSILIEKSSLRRCVMPLVMCVHVFRPYVNQLRTIIDPVYTPTPVEIYTEIDTD